MQTALVFVAGIVIGALILYFARSLFSRDGAQMTAAQCEAVVRLWLEGTTIKARPHDVCLAKGRPLTWEIQGDGDIEIEFETKNNSKGPFPHEPDPKKNPHNKGRGLYKRALGDKRDIASNLAEMPDRWKYTVRWTPPGGSTQVLDPVVCIRK